MPRRLSPTSRCVHYEAVALQQSLSHRCNCPEMSHWMVICSISQAQAARIANLEEQMDDLGLSGYRQERSIDRDFSAISLRYVLLHTKLNGLMTKRALKTL